LTALAERYPEPKKIKQYYYANTVEIDYGRVISRLFGNDQRTTAVAEDVMEEK